VNAVGDTTTPAYANVADLRRTISTELLLALGLPLTSPLQALLRPLVWPPAHRFARLAAEFDRRMALYGLTAALRWALPYLVDGIQAQGTEHIEATGPLVIASNHPGGCDGLVIASYLARDDLRALATDVPFLRGMVASSPHLIYTSRDNTHGRMAVVREAVRHLKAGGALLVFPSGQVDPDPALLPGAQAALQKWSASLLLFLRQVSEAKVLPTIVSGVLAPACFRHPLTRLHKQQRPRQLLAEFLQIGQQVLFGRRFALAPTVRFGEPLTVAALGDARDTQSALSVLIARAQNLLETV
jgi:1-acyl-sn-glycerol-3-phosphate acyltransferase